MIFKKLIYLLLIVFAACALPEKTSEEFRQTARTRSGVKTLTVDASLETVMERIRTHAKKCNTFGVTQTRREVGRGANPAGGGSYSMRLLNRWERAKTDKPTFIIYDPGDQDINRQPQGFFRHIIDLERKGPKTLVNLYDHNHFMTYEYNAEFVNVVAGKKAVCQFDELNK